MTSTNKPHEKSAGVVEDRPSAHLQARILAEAIPHLIRYDEQTVVVKFGGHAMGDEQLSNAFAQDIVYLKQSGINPIVVHGGGPQIASMLKKLEIKSDFVNGLRVTDKPTVEVVEMVLAGKINKEIVSAINRQGGKAVGISGKDANLMIAKKITEMADPQSNLMKAVDIGFVGDPLEVNPHIVEVISKSDLIPVIALFGIGKPSGIIATIIFGIPPVVRLTALGITSVPASVREAAVAFGASRRFILFKVDLPTAAPSIMAGISQTILMCLSMVVIAALIGAKGLGEDVLHALQYAAQGQGLLAGLAILLCAIVLDRVVQGRQSR